MVCFPRCLFGPAMFGLMWLCSYGEPSQVTLRFSEIITILYAQLHVMCLKPRYTEDWFIETPQSKNWLKFLLKKKAHCKNWWCHQVTYDCDLKQNMCTTVRSILFWTMTWMSYLLVILTSKRFNNSFAVNAKKHFYAKSQRPNDPLKTL